MRYFMNGLAFGEWTEIQNTGLDVSGTDRQFRAAYPIKLVDTFPKELAEEETQNIGSPGEWLLVGQGRWKGLMPSQQDGHHVLRSFNTKPMVADRHMICRLRRVQQYPPCEQAPGSTSKRIGAWVTKKETWTEE